MFAKWKPICAWEREGIFILVGIGILVAGIVLGLLGAWLQIRREQKGRDRK